ncbi:MAG: aminotransferase class V-fold PLP-dependent enzyme [Proteobacteria bacterium]|nr:aminotransferase class V-fold PLP-dependent enzyme [Pseudomonadota bacterium]
MAKFGRAIRGEWLIEEDIRFLNHGSYGAAPKVVLDAQSRWRGRMERQPVRFMTDELPAHLRAAAAGLAAYLGADGDDLVFVDNATTAVNAVLRSLAFAPGDEIVTTTHAYNAVRNAIKYVCDRTGAVFKEAAIPFPATGDDAEVIAAVEAGITPRTRLAVIDHVGSETALVLPIARLIPLLKHSGVPVLVDGAHAPGMIPLALNDLGADWYVGNGHKWLCAPKGCAFLWARPERQAEIHPTVISRGLGQGFTAEFDWQGTRDFSPWLAVTDALAFRRGLGDGVARYCKGLVRDAAEHLAAAWKTEIGTPERMQGFMITLRLPAGVEPTVEAAAALRQCLLADHRLETKIFPLAGALWLRLSAFVYNEFEDYSPLAELLARPERLLGDRPPPSESRLACSAEAAASAAKAGRPTEGR